jgi:ketosteroid isomerase-like protein
MMKRTPGLTFLAFALCLLGIITASSTLGRQIGTLQKSLEPSGREPFFIFNKVVPAIRRESRVPPRLPGSLPDVDDAHPIYAILQAANPSGYAILLAFDESCEGQNNCLYGSVEGSFSPFGSEEGKITPIKLRGGIPAQFVESVCYAYCNQAYVRWSQDGFYYSIGIKAEAMEPLIATANSAASDPNSVASDVTQQIAKLRGQWAQELHDKQLDQIIALYAPDAAFLAPSGRRFTGQTAIRGLFKTIMDTVTSNITFHSIVTESSGDLAFDSGDYSETLVPTKSGPDQHYKGDYLIVFRRQKDGKWLIVQQVWTFAGNDLLPPSK